jgi:hypothetical protein
MSNEEKNTISADLLARVQSYVDEHYVDDEHISLGIQLAELGDFYDEQETLSTRRLMKVKKSSVSEPSIDYLVGNLNESFSEKLLRLIDVTGKKDSDVYNRANIDRRLFSKIRNNTEYNPSKPTVLAFAIALELNLDQTEDLLQRAGFALSRSRKLDVIVEFFIQNSMYNIYEINEVLHQHDQPLLGG